MASGDTLFDLTPGTANPVATDGMTHDTRNEQPVQDADATTNETTVHSVLMPQAYDGGGVDVIVELMMSSAEAGNVDVNVYFERGTGLDHDGDSFAAAQSVNDTVVPGTSGVSFKVTVPFTDGGQMDSLDAGDRGRIKVERGAAADTAVGDWEFMGAEIRESA